jgi:putative LysE/RhtB family amino acid efflux pump
VRPLIIGIGLGFVVALQLGPMSLFLVRSTLRAGWRVGLAIAAGIGIVDALYAAAGAAGAASLFAIRPLRVSLGVLGAAVLIGIGAHALRGAVRGRSLESVSAAAAPRRAFLVAVAGTASNPLTIASWAAVFTAAGVAGVTDTAGRSALLVAGVGLGSLASGAALTTGTAVARRVVGERLVRITDVAAGVGLIGFGVALGYASVA